MKKAPVLFLVFLLVFSLSCYTAINLPSIMEKISEVIPQITNFVQNPTLPKLDDTLDTSKETNSSNTKEEKKDESISEDTSKLSDNKFSKYFSSKEGVQVSYIGDLKYGSSIDIVQYIKGNKIQILSVCGSRIQKVLEFTDKGVFLVNQMEMKDEEIPSSIMNNSTVSVPLIKGDLSLGTKWTDSKDNSYEITAVDKPCSTKAGEFISLEVTKVEKSNKYITKDYYGTGVGLIKSVTRDNKNNIISIKQADTIQK